MAAQQERYFPYLVGYVALYTNDLATAEAQLTSAVGMRGNERDAFMHCLLGLTLERLGPGTIRPRPSCGRSCARNWEGENE